MQCSSDGPSNGDAERFSGRIRVRLDAVPELRRHLPGFPARDGRVQRLSGSRLDAVGAGAAIR
jgi:hypothetical protein